MNVLNVENVSKNFTVSGKNLEVINSLSFDIEKGESVAVLGDNGAGKTTLLRMICGLISQDSGSIKLFGKEPLNNPLLLADVGVSLEGNRSLYWRLNPIENIEYFGILKGIKPKDAKKKGEMLLDQFGLLDKKYCQIKTLSKGMQQKISLIIAFLGEPKLMILDEPSVGLDIDSIVVLKELIATRMNDGASLVLTTHQLDVAESIVDNIALLRRGSILKKASVLDFSKEHSKEHYVIKLKESITEITAREVEKQFNASVKDNVVKCIGDDREIPDLISFLKEFGFVSAYKEEVTLSNAYKNIKSPSHL